MANVIPFRAIRPEQDKVHLVASRSVDGYTASALKEKLAANPFTFLHIINPDFSDGLKTKPGSRERLKKVKDKFKTYMRENIFVHDTIPGYYVYRQMKDEMVYTGIIACTGIDDYLNGIIKKHEQTITSREEKLKDYLEVCEFNAEPVLFCYPNDEEIDETTLHITQQRPDYDFTSTDQVRHTLWVVNDKKNVQLISSRFAKIPSIYIADGHHRSASSALLGTLKRSRRKSYTGTEAFNYYLGVFFPETQLRIFDYNRVVKDLNGYSVDNLLKKIAGKFEVKPVAATTYKPTRKHVISMYAAGNWYALTAKKGTYRSDDPVGSLDASILTEHILAPLLNIHDLRTDKRIAFVPGIKGAKELKKQVDEGKACIAFGLYPVTMEHLKWIADTNNIMPPKSTWVEPKIRSGLVIYSLEDE